MKDILVKYSVSLMTLYVGLYLLIYKINYCKKLKPKLNGNLFRFSNDAEKVPFAQIYRIIYDYL